MKNEKVKTEAVHFVQYLKACGRKKFFRLCPIPLIINHSQLIINN